MTSLIVIALLLTVGCQLVRHSRGAALGVKPDNAIRVATYNVHYIILHRKTGAWGTDDWERRKRPLDATFKTLNADVIAFQEMESFAGGNTESVNLARSYLLDNNPQYSAAAIGPSHLFPSTQPVFYVTEKFSVLDQGWFFFSETPDQIYSRTFNGSYPAYASWVEFKDKQSDQSFKVVNIHTDFKSRENRSRSIDLVAERIQPWIDDGESVLVAGDFNARLGSSLHKRLNAVGLTFAPVTGSTYHFNRGLNLFGAIDHIAHTSDVEVAGAPVVVRDKGEGWGTDHYPVVVDFLIR